MTAAYRIQQADAHLSNFESQLRAMPDDIDPEALGRFADRIKAAHDEVLHAMAYARVCRARKVEAEARVDATLAEAKARLIHSSGRRAA